MVTAATSDFVKTANRLAAPPFSLIQQKSLVSRLLEELGRAMREFGSDPRAFVRDLFADDTKDAKRRRRLYFGLAGAIAIHASLLTLIAVIGWHSLNAAKEDKSPVVTMLAPPSPGPLREEAGADVPRAKKDSGGGNGGRDNSPPVTKGIPPPSFPRPQIVAAFAPSRPLPSLPVQPTVVGPEAPVVAARVPFGVPDGREGEPPAPGTGKGDGMGGKDGSGVGSGPGSGNGPGRNSGIGTESGDAGTPDGGGHGGGGPIDWRRPPKIGYTPFSWIYRARPIVPPEAEKIAGTVLLRATLNADGTITDVEVVNPVQFLTDPAIEALKRCRFRPATVNGVPVTLTKVLIKQEVHY